MASIVFRIYLPFCHSSLAGNPTWPRDRGAILLPERQTVYVEKLMSIYRGLSDPRRPPPPMVDCLAAGGYCVRPEHLAPLVPQRPLGF